MKRFLFLVVISVLMFTGCNKYKDVQLESVKMSSFSLKSTSSAVLAFNVVADNPTNTSLMLTCLEGVLMKDDKEFANFELSNVPTLGPLSKDSFSVRLDLSLIDPISLLSVGLNIKSWRLEDFRLNGKVTIKSGSGGKKSFKFKNMPLNKVINTFM